jgi:D-sedoheptulose 7-phosphate isomerase
MEKKIKKILKETISVQQKISENYLYLQTIIKITQLIIQCLKDGGKVILCGNGGSAADSQHIAAEFVGRFKIDRNPLPAIALSTNTSILTCLGNDYSYQVIFSRQVQALAKKEDVLIAISTSGRSINVIEAVKTAKSIGLKSIALTGKDGGKLAKIADVSFIVPSNETPRIQESHITIAHIICELVEEQFFKK